MMDNRLKHNSIEDAIEEIKSYTIGGDVLTFSTLFALIGNETVINKGICGAGKSRSSKDLIENLLDVENVVIKTGYMTPKGFYNLIKENREKRIVLDEADILLDVRRITQMMKSLLTSRMVVWETDNKDTEPIHFTGSFILNCNDYNFGKGIEDKALTNRTALSTREFKKKIKEGRNYEPEMSVWNTISKRISFARENDVSISDETRNRVYEFILDLPTITSYRVKDRTFKVFNGLKALLGNLDSDGMNEDLFELGKVLSKKLMPNSQLAKIMASEGNQIRRKDLAEKLKAVNDYSKRTAYRRIDSLIGEGYLKEVEDNERLLKRPDNLS